VHTVNNKELARKIENIKRRGTKEFILQQKEANPYAEAQFLPFKGKGDLFCTGNASFGVGFGMEEAVVHKDLEAMEEFVRNLKRIPYIQFELTPFCDPLLIRLLQERRYTLDHFLSVWVLELDGWQPPENLSQDRAVTIQEVAGEEKFEWAWTVALGISEDGTVSEEAMESTRIFLDVPSNAGFLLQENGKSAAGGTLAIDGPLAELFLASTVKTFRGRGYQNLLIQERLRHAKTKGCTHAAVTTKPDTASARNMERSGFQLMYNKAVLRSPAIQ
jgi:GNAT superfamily N-acetyltransferase